MTTQQEVLDTNKALEFALHVADHLKGATVSVLAYVGGKLGLYKTMAGAGPLTAEDLAERTGLHPRWLAEWLRNQGAANFVTYRGDDRFELTAEQAAVLADDEGSPFFMFPMFIMPGLMMNALPHVPESFRTGVGHDFDTYMGDPESHALAPGFATWWDRHMLVPVALPALDGVVPKLEAGAKVGDVGCGTGVALIEMAKAYPTSEFHGFELSKLMLEAAQHNKQDAGVTNVTFHDVRGEQLPCDGSFDFVISFDCIHDMTHPREVIAAVRKALKDDGTYLIAEPQAKPTYEENVAENPMMAATAYGISLLICMSSALSEPDGEGLGTLGFHENLAREVAAEAGFTRFQVQAFADPINAYYELRP